MVESKLTKSSVLENIDFRKLSKSCKTQKDLSSLTKEFMKNMIENILKSELEEHLEKTDKDSKNGYYKKNVLSDSGNLKLDIPRDRAGQYQPQLIPKGERTISGIDSKIISLYARGMSLGDIEKQVR
jgi:putative transposase